MEPTPRELTIAKRRLHSAFCAFDGNKTKPYSQQISHDISSCFRSKTDGVNFNSSYNKSQNQLHYEQELKLRYFENETRLSWDIEKNPPVDNGENTGSGRNSFLHDYSSPNRNKAKIDKPHSLRYEESQRSDFKVESDLSRNDEGDTKRTSETPKAKYRCKLCGQPKKITHILTNNICREILV